MRVLVTDGTGFVGYNTIQKLLDLDCEVVTTDHRYGIRKLPRDVNVLYPSVLGINWKAVGKIDIAFHFAIFDSHAKNSHTELKYTNVEATDNLFDHLIQKGCKKVIYASSLSVYGNSGCPQSEDMPRRPLDQISKNLMAIEDLAGVYAKAYPDTSFIGLRYAKIYGPGERDDYSNSSMIHKIAKKIKNNIRPSLLDSGWHLKDWIYIKDVIKANLLAMELNQSCGFNCCTGESTCDMDILSKLHNLLKIEYQVPKKILNYDNAKTQYVMQGSTIESRIGLKFSSTYSLDAGLRDYYESGELI